MMTEREPEWLTVQDVVKLLQVNEETVRRWIRAGDLAVLDIGDKRGTYRIRREDLDVFIAARYGPKGKNADG